MLGHPLTKIIIDCHSWRSIPKPREAGAKGEGSQIIKTAQWIASTALIWETLAPALRAKIMRALARDRCPSLWGLSVGGAGDPAHGCGVGGPPRYGGVSPPADFSRHDTSAVTNTAHGSARQIKTRRTYIVRRQARLDEMALKLGAGGSSSAVGGFWTDAVSPSKRMEMGV